MSAPTDWDIWELGDCSHQGLDKVDCFHSKARVVKKFEYDNGYLVINNAGHIKRLAEGSYGKRGR